MDPFDFLQGPPLPVTPEAASEPASLPDSVVDELMAIAGVEAVWRTEREIVCSVSDPAAAARLPKERAGLPVRAEPGGKVIAGG